MKATASIGGNKVEVEVGELRGEQAAELVFARLNHGSGSELPGYKGRSMSVGDTVEVPVAEDRTATLRCAGLGWEVLS